jgi:hypothetical protein
MSAIRSQQNQDNEIWNQQSKIESIGLIKPFESGIKEMLTNVVPNAPGGRESSESDRRIGDDVQLRSSFSLKAIQTGKLLYVRGPTKSGAPLDSLRVGLKVPEREGQLDGVRGSPEMT